MIDALDRSDANVFSSFVGWLEGTLLGTIATAVAIIAIASVGLLMLTGRIDVRRAAQVVFGCFVIFGASPIASGILTAISARGGSFELAQAAAPPPPLPSPPTTALVPSTPYNPYTSAAYLPPR